MASVCGCTKHLLRWAVLKHTTAEGVHWDVLLEPAGEQKLLTWRVMSPPTAWLCGGQKLEAVRVSDHRSIYLTYEGDISGDRGHVIREASGTWKPVEIAADRVCGLLTGGLTIWLRQVNDDQWSLAVERS